MADCRKPGVLYRGPKTQQNPEDRAKDGSHRLRMRTTMTYLDWHKRITAETLIEKSHGVLPMTQVFAGNYVEWEFVVSLYAHICRGFLLHNTIKSIDHVHVWMRQQSQGFVTLYSHNVEV
jgi:hypothetical protein